MKRTIALILSLTMLLAVSACGKTEAPEDLPDASATKITEEAEEGKDSEPAAETPAEEETTEPEASEEDASAPASSEESENSPADETEPEKKQDPEPENEVPAAEPVKMTIPTDYKQVYDRLASAGNSRGNGMVYDIAAADLIVDEAAAEEMAVEAPAPMPEAKAAAMDTMEYGIEAEIQTGFDSGDDHSETNSQVAGIDEGDIVKTDGKYIYVLKNGNELVILSAAGEETEVLSDTVLYDDTDNYKSENKANGDYYYSSSYRYGSEMYINGDTLAILWNCNEWWDKYENGEYSYSDSTETTAELYDVSDPWNPRLSETLGQEGYLSASRMMGDDLYVISRQSTWIYADVAEDDYDSYIPYLRTGEEKVLIPVDRIICPPVIETTDYTIICRYDLSEHSREDVKTILGAGDTVYMSPNALYLAGTRYTSEETESHRESVYKVTTTESRNTTTIIKLDLADELTVTATCEFEGNLLNQFAMDEYDGNLRVVATVNTDISTRYEDEEYGFSNYIWDNRRSNALYIFDEDLYLTGSVTELAENEQVYSVRFNGNVGYFVTFRTVDPLFAVDLSDPTDPKVMSALKIPGFSRYLHPYSDTLLFGLGQNADEENGWTENMKLSMFDVSDPYNVFERDKLTLDISYSTALYNHKAILVAPNKALIGFPSENGYLLYTYDEESGFELIDEVKIDDFWWNGDSRGLYAGEYFYIVTPNFTVVLDMEDFDLIARVKY